jgi:hypothetical protein
VGKQEEEVDGNDCLSDITSHQMQAIRESNNLRRLKID